MLSDGAQRILESGAQNMSMGERQNKGPDGSENLGIMEHRARSHNLLIQNLPVSVSEKEFKKLMKKYGKIVSIKFVTERGNKTKKTMKSATATFESEEGVENVLKNQPIMLFGSHSFSFSRLYE